MSSQQVAWMNAHHIRSARSLARKDVASGTRDEGVSKLVAVCDDIAVGEPCPEHLNTLVVSDWLTWPHLIGASHAARVLRRAAAAPRLASPVMTVGMMTRREAQVLAHAIVGLHTDYWRRKEQRS